MDTELQLLRRKSFECWRIYATTKLSRRRSIRKAVYSYKVRLKQKALNSLLRNCIEAKTAHSFYASLSTVSNGCMEFQAASDLHRKTILKRALHSWFLFSRSRRRKKSLNVNISKLRDQLVLGKYIQDWKLICLEKKRKEELEEKAIAFYRGFLLRKSLGLWLEGHIHRLHEKKKWEDAIVHYHRKLVNKIWHAWIKYCNIKIEKANKIAEIRKFYEMKLLRRCFSTLVSAIVERALHEAAMNFYLIRLLRRVLLIWINYHRRTIEFERKIGIHCKKRENTLKQKILRQWRLYIWKKKCSRRKVKNAKNHYKRKLSATAITVTKKYVLYRKQKKASLLYLISGIDQISLTVQKAYIDKWRIALIRLAQERQKFRRAEEHWAACTLKHCFFIWKIFSEHYKVRARRKEKLSEIGRCVLLNKYLSCWRAKYAAAAIINEKGTHVAAIYSKKIKSRLFKSWKRYTDETTKRKMETDEATKFHRQLVPHDSPKETSKSFSSRLKSAKKSSVQDFRIMRKSFNKWLAFLSDREDRKIRGFFSRNINRRPYEVPYSTRLVLPEYMRKKAIDSRDNCGFYEGNTRKDNFEFSEFTRRYLPFESGRSRSADRSTSGSETSNDSSPATYSIASPIYVRNGIQSSSDCFQ